MSNSIHFLLRNYRKRSFILITILFCLLLVIVYDLAFMNSIKNYFYPRESLACYRIQNRDSYPDISNAVIQKKSIFFHETSCKSHKEGRTFLNSRQACAIESAARMNPNLDIFVLFTSPGIFVNKNAESDKIIESLFTYKNIKFYRLNYENYTKGTRVELLYQNGDIESSYYAISHASDVLRYLTLWKFGGIYLDLDVIVIKSLEGLPDNYAAVESENNVAAGVLNFASDGLGHFLAEECLIDLSQHFSKDDWGFNGPGVITRLLKRICGAKTAGEMVNKNCRGFMVYPSDYFYSIPWCEWKQYFDENYTQTVLDKIKNSYVVHVWNKHSQSDKNPVYKNNSYNFLAKQYCPKVFSKCTKFF